MRRHLLAATLLLAATPAVAQKAPVVSDAGAGRSAPWKRGGGGAAAEELAVRRTLDHYVRGHATGMASHFRVAFAKGARLVRVADGRVVTSDAETLIAAATGRPAAGEASRKRRVVSVHHAGDAAMAVLETSEGPVRTTDYLSLLRYNGQWRIVSATSQSVTTADGWRKGMNQGAGDVAAPVTKGSKGSKGARGASGSASGKDSSRTPPRATGVTRHPAFGGKP